MITPYLQNGQTLYKVSVVRGRGRNRKHLRAFGFTSPQAAEKEQKTLVNKVVRQILEADDHQKNITWRQVVRQFEDAIYTGQGFDSVPEDPTKDDYIAILRNHTADWYARPFCAVTRGDLRALCSKLQTSGGVLGRPFTIKGLRKVKLALNKLYTWVIENRIVPEVYINPTVGLNFGRDTDSRQTGMLTLGEAQRFLEQAYFQKHPWRYVWHMALLTGMRNGELYAAKWVNVSFENSELDVMESYNKRMANFKCPKNGKSRKVPISPELKNLLQELRAITGTTEFVLPRMRDWRHGMQAAVLGQFLTSIGLRPIRFHDLRACFTTHCLRAGIPVIQVQAIGGWQDIKTMNRYLRIAGVDIKGATDALSFYNNQENPVLDASERFTKKQA